MTYLTYPLPLPRRPVSNVVNPRRAVFAAHGRKIESRNVRASDDGYRFPEKSILYSMALNAALESSASNTPPNNPSGGPAGIGKPWFDTRTNSFRVFDGTGDPSNPDNPGWVSIGQIDPDDHTWLPPISPSPPLLSLVVDSGGSLTIGPGIVRVYVTTSEMASLTLPRNDCMIMDRTGVRTLPIVLYCPSGSTINGNPSFAIVSPWDVRSFLYDGVNYGIN